MSYRILRLDVVEGTAASDSQKDTWLWRYSQSPVTPNLVVQLFVFSLLVLSQAVDVGSMQVGSAS